MAGLNTIDDSSWPEVENINSHAMFRAYLTLVVRGLGVLMSTWATVVLLGGFVSNLKSRDFWYLTFITLVQTARVFDFVMKEGQERTSDIWSALKGCWYAVSKQTTFFRTSKKKKGKAGSAACSSLYLLGPSISFTLSGWRLIDVCYDGVASLEEEKKDCCCVDKDDDEHLTAWALIVLYSLGVVQGYVFLYAGIIVPARGTGLPKEVAGDYSLDTQLVSEYLEETVKECTKDPSFARGRNLVTYAVDLLLMEPMSSSTFTSSSSNGSRSCSSKHYLSGLAILGSILQQRDDDDTEEEDTTRRPWLHGQAAMLKHLLTSSASFGQVIHRLLETLGPGSPYSGAVRAHAARVLAEVAGSVRLEEFPGATQCISSSLLCTFEEHCWRPEGYERDGDLPDEYERDWLLDEQECRYILEVVRRRRGRCLTRTLLLLRRCLLKPFGGDAPPQVTQESDGEKSRRSLVRGYVGLVISGLRVLQALAASEDNCVSFISSTRGGGGGGELSRTMRPLTSDGLHRDHHDEWCMIAEESLKLLTLLMAAPGETGKALRVQIAGDTAGAVAALETVLGCPRCQVALKRRAVEVVLGLGLPPPVDTSSSSIVVAPRGSRSTTTTSIFMGILLHISLLPDKHFGGMSGPTHVLKKRSCTRRLAGEKLLAMASAASQQPSAGDDDDDDDGGGGATATATSMLQAAGVALGNLTSTVVGAEHDASWRIHAAHILEDLCRDYTKDDEYLKEIKKAMCLAMPEVIKQLLGGCGSTTQQAITVTEAKKIVHCQKAPAASTDLEQGAVSGDTIGEETAPSPHHRQQPQDDEQPADEGITELYQALVSLCHGIPNSWIETDKDLASELNGIAAEMGVPFSTFISLRAELKRRYCWEEKNARVRTN